MGLGKSDKQYREVGGLPTFGADKEKLQAPSSKPQRSSKHQSPIEAAPAPVTAKSPGLISRWLAKLKGLFGRKSSGAAIPKFARQPVQGELSLDNVKVMRNDLSDTDFEFVAKPLPTKKKAAPAALEEAKIEAAAPVSETGTKIWNRVTTLLGAGQS
jgi:hypothetical protein